ncbi:killer toxin resistant protein [Tilletia horrida]|uniref:Killer toxin resistant protein n=1 Tax=Tilletia horrida TaxID=155126 RepID=A0AAN6JHL2_9BASI|nr:killer toxin resistant protein [Tilletia horrida]
MRAFTTAALGSAWALLPLLLLLLSGSGDLVHAKAADTSTSSSPSSSSPPVSIKLRGPWPVQPPLLLEILEAVASEEPEAFFPLVTHLTGPWALSPGSQKAADAGLALAQASAEQVYRAAHAQLDKHAFLSDRAARQNFNLSLALHATSPRVEAFWQVYATSGLERRWEEHMGIKKDAGDKATDGAGAREKCGSWVDWAGQVLCGKDELRDALAKATEGKPKEPSPALLPFDHVLPARLPSSASPSGASKTDDQAAYTAVLYAEPFSSNFWDLHTTLFEHALGSRAASASTASSSDAPLFRYVLRWRPPTARLVSGRNEEEVKDAKKPVGISAREEPYARQHSYLSSFGGTLDLKKVDYLVIDDRKLKHSSSSSEAAGTSPASGPQSVDLPALEERQREREEQILTHRLLTGGDAALPNENATEGNLADLTPDEIEMLGVRASTLILQSPNPLMTLRQLSHNFPSYAVALAKSFEQRLAAGGTEDESRSFEAAQEIYQRQGYSVQPGSSDIWLNGRGLTDAELWPLSLIKLMRRERQIVRALERIHPSLNRTQAVDLLQFPAISRAMSGGGSSGPAGGGGGGPPGAAADDVETIFFDASDRIERKALVAKGEEDISAVQGPITYWNNIEKDTYYKRYPTSLQTLLRPAWPGSLPTVRRNILNVVIVMDLRRRDTVHVLSETVAMMIPRLGLRWGFVPGGLELDGKTEKGRTSLQLARLYYLSFLRLNINQVTTMFLRLAGRETEEHFLSLDELRDEAIKALRHAGKKAPADQDWTEYIDEVLLAGKDADVESLVQAAAQYTRRLRATTQANARGHFFVNGQHLPFSPTAMQALNALISEQLQILAKQIYQGHVDDDTDVDNYFYDREDAFVSRPALVFPEVDAETGSAPPLKIVDLLEATEGFAPHGQVVNAFVYPIAEADGEPAPTPNATTWVVGDLDSPRGARLLQTSLKMVSEARTRLGFVHLPSSRSAVAQSEVAHPRLSTFLYGLISRDTVKHITPDELSKIVDDFVGSLPPSTVVPVGRIHDDYSADAKQKVLAQEGGGAAATLLGSYAKEAGWQLADAVESTAFWEQAAIFARRLDVQPESLALVINGRVVTVPDEEVAVEDLRTLLKYENTRRIAAVLQGLEAVGIVLDDLGRESYTDTVTLASSVLAKAFNDEGSDGGLKGGPELRSFALERLPASDSSIEIGNRDTATFRLVAMLNPLAERAQRMIGMIDLLSRMEGVWIKIIFNPHPMLTELPLKRFYRFSAPHQLSFAAEDEVPASVTFLDMPEEAVLTMGLEAPSPWLTMPEEAIYDLDNIRLKDVPPQDKRAGVSATYEIKHVLIEGHAQSDGRTPPRGLQLVLESPDGSEQLDTIVMANLAYFQFKARPGMFHLAIREGRSSDIYQMESVGTRGFNSPNVSVTGNIVVLDSLSGLTILPRFVKRPGMEEEDVLESDIDKSLNEGRKRKKTSYFGQAKEALSSLAKKGGSLTGSSGPNSSNRTNAAINIFTVASGHLYERMTYIMVLSVVKHTKSTVKFWFIENFLSPSFKDFIPHLAAEYGFQYELITYAWPHWLRPQREKQRTIWGYKILFLDVLFPLDLDKVIFVDADQIVRTDMKELVDLDLNGAPYGYPPMGNDSYDMDNFRFWEQGYWKEFLRGKPYHISALYVVDLNRFREVAAGDILRGQYQGLSADPNSLANLDQDLPNHLQHTVPIHTLDKTWLWCETWCSTEWLPQAKTIDLCSNPKTKEPKLDRARRQIPEWTVYDDEVAAFAQRLAEANRLGKNVVAPAEVERIGVRERMEEVGKGDDVPALTSAASSEEVSAEGKKHDAPANAMSHFGGYSTRGASGIGTPAASVPGTPAGAATPPIVPVRRPVGRPRKTAPAGQPTATQNALQAAGFSTPQPSRTAQNAQAATAATARSQAQPESNEPVGLLANPYASAAFTGNLRSAGPPKDGTETQFYLIPGPTNRMLLSVCSGVPSQIDWGLNKLVQSSHAYADGIQFEQLPGLYDQLLSFPRRVARAWSGAPEEQWAQEFFETDEPPEAYCPPEGHIAHERHNPYDDLSATAVASSSSRSDTFSAFAPSQIASHASLLRRALEAGLVLRNLSMMPHNTRWLTSRKPQARKRIAHTAKVVSEVLRIARPTGTIPFSTDASGNPTDEDERLLRDDGVVLENLSTLELEGLSELKSYMLDLFETIAPFVALERGAPANFGVVLSTRQRIEGPAAHAALVAQEKRHSNLKRHRQLAQRPPARADKSGTVTMVLDRSASTQAHSTSSGTRPDEVSPGDSVFHSLLSLAHHAADRNLVVVALRCLAALAGYTIQNRSIGFTEREWDVVEVVQPEGSAADGTTGPIAYVTKVHSPGLLHLTALFIPLLHLRRTDPHPSLRSMGTAMGHTALAHLPPNGIAPSVKLEGDTDLGEAALDLLSQVIQIEGNALRIGMTTFSSQLAGAAQANAADLQSERTAVAVVSDPSITTSKPGAPLSPTSLFSFLTLLLPFQRVAWLRTSQLMWNPAVLPTDLPSLLRHDATQRMIREQKKRAQRRMLGYREDEESLVERNMRKRLRIWEAAELEGLREPDRALKWMTLVFALSPDAELTQMEFWQSYQEEFRGSHTPLLNASELIKLIAEAFPGASAMVVKPSPSAPQRFIIKGIDIRQREDYGPLECRWAGAAYLCSFIVPEFDAPSSDSGSAERRRLSDAERRDILKRHLLTHLQRRGLQAMGSAAETHDVQNDSTDTPSAKRIRLDKSVQVPGRHSTVDRPGLLYYTVARTPMDPTTAAPVGTASISSQILRSLARIASRVLDRAGQRPELPSSLDLVPEGSLLDMIGAEDARLKALAGVLGPASGTMADNDKFGFPALPQDECASAVSAPAVSATPAAPKSKEEQAADAAIAAHIRLIRGIFGVAVASGDGLLSAGTSLGTGTTAADEAAALASANAVMDSLLSVENALISTSGENDVLCPALNDALVELRPESAPSVYMAQ